MKINSQKLSAALKALAPIAKNRATLPILNCVLLTQTGDALSITADDLDQRATENLECEPSGESGKFDHCVNFGYLSASITADEFTDLTFTEKHLEIKPAGVKLGLLGAAEFPMPSDDKMRAIGVSCADVADGVEAVSWACGNPEMYDINCVHVLGQPKSLVVESTNLATIARFERGIIGADFDVCIPEGFCGSLATALRREGAVLSLSDRRAQVAFEGGIYSCKLSETRFKNTKQLIDAKFNPIGEIDCEKLSSMLRVAVSVYDNPSEFPSGKFSFASDGVRVVSTSKVNHFERELAGEFRDAKFAVNIDRLLKSMAAINLPKIKIAQNDEFSPIKLNGGDLTVLLQPMRIS